MSALPDGWTQMTLGGALSSAVIFTDGDWVETKDQDPTGDVRLTQLADVGVAQWRNRSNRYMNLSRAQQMGCTFLEPGDVLVARMPDPLGRACIFPGDPKPCVTAVDVCVIRPDPRVLSARWLMWALNAPATQAQMVRLQSGTTRKRISRRNLGTINLLIPPRPEQERIVAAIEEQVSRLNTAEQLLRSAHSRLDPLVVSFIDVATDGFPTKPLGELVREPLRNGHSAKRSTTGSIPVFTLTAVTARNFSEANTKLTDADPQRVGDLWAEPGDIFVERSNTPELVGTAALYAGPARRAIFPDLLIRVRCGPQLLPEYAELGLRSTRIRRYFQRVAKGIAGSMPKIDQDAVLAAELPLPPVTDQARLVQEVERNVSIAESLATAVNHALLRSRQLRHAILERAFTGQLTRQDPSDEPAAILMERIAAKRGVESARRRQPTRRTLSR